MVRCAGLLLFLTIAAFTTASCGDEQEPAPQPAWGRVAPEQIAEAKRLGVPVAFENDIGMRFVLIPAGTFTMGSAEDAEGRFADEGPQHEVVVSPFYLAAVEVTNAHFRRFKPDHRSGEYEGRSLDGDNQPVVQVSDNDATEFVDWLSGREDGTSYRLPSEAEWEYACRAGTTTRYWSGNLTQDLAQVGWYNGNSGGRTHAVGGKPANPLGLHDMHGNVWEWCEDAYHDSYHGAPSDGSVWVDESIPTRVLRGGSWFLRGRFSRSAARIEFGQGERSPFVGFRPAVDVALE